MADGFTFPAVTPHEWRKNTLRGVANWLRTRSTTVWEQSFGHSSLMVRWADDLERIERELRPTGTTTEYGWLIENGKPQGLGLAYRYIDNDGGGIPAWTEDPNKALRFARRADAEQYAHHDEDAWRIVEHAWDAPHGVGEVPRG